MTIMQRWWMLPVGLRTALLFGGYVLVSLATLALGLRSTPYALLYLYLLGGVFLATFVQGYILTALVVVTTLAMGLWPPVITPPSLVMAPATQVVAAELFIALTAISLAVVLQQRRTERREFVSVRYHVRVLRALGAYALTRLSRDAILQVLCPYVLDTLGADMVMLLLADETRTVLRGYVAYGDRPGTEPVERTIRGTVAGSIFLGQRTRIIRDALHEEGLIPELKRNGNAVIGVPLLLGGLTIGILYVGNATKHSFSAADAALVEALAGAIAVPLYASKTEGATTGGLTTDSAASSNGTKRAEHTDDSRSDPAQKGSV